LYQTGDQYGLFTFTQLYGLYLTGYFVGSYLLLSWMQ